MVKEFRLSWLITSVKSVPIVIVVLWTGVHISDIGKREEFRRHSVIAPACVAQVKGLGKEGYLRALDILLEGE